MKFSTTRLAAAGILGAMAVTAVAGAKLTQEVQFDLQKGSARGVMADARNSVDTVQYIGCSTEGTWATCFAVNAAGESHSCTTTDPVQIGVINTIQDGSKIFFRWDANGKCFQLTVTNDSRYATK